MLSWLLTADRSLSPPSALASGRRDSAWVHCRRSCGSRARTCSRRACRQCRRFHSPASRSVESSHPEASANQPSSTPRKRPKRPSVSASLGHWQSVLAGRQHRPFLHPDPGITLTLTDGSTVTLDQAETRTAQRYAPFAWAPLRAWLLEHVREQHAPPGESNLSPGPGPGPSP